MIESRYYQPEAVDWAVKYLFEANGNGLIALPTGTGKSVVIVLLILRLIELYYSSRVIVLTHSLELVGQNAERFRQIAGNVPYGINCDGLNRRDTMHNVIFGSIGSVVSMLDQYRPFDVIIVDEAHRIPESEKSMYSQFIIWARSINPNVRLIGLSATCYDNYGSIIRRNEKTGEIESLFTDIIYDKTDSDSFIEFVAAGWLCKLIAIPTKTEYDISKVGLTGRTGEFNQSQLQKATDIAAKTEQAVAEMIYTANMDNRHCGLVFANGISHCEHVAEEFAAQGDTAVFVHSKMTKSKLLDAYDAFHSAEAKWMVNNGKLTTGYDWPPVDIIGVLRHTNQVDLWGQILGRGTRPYDFNRPGPTVDPHLFPYTKWNTLVMDFARNTSRLGPIDAPYFKKRTKGDPGDAPVKICPKCSAYNYASARICAYCDHEFSFEVKFEVKAGDDAPMSTLENLEPVVEVQNVTYINYEKVEKTGAPAMLKVIYHCGVNGNKHTEVVCIEHKTNAHRYAWAWWTSRTELPMPSTVDAALKITHVLRRPKSIEVEKQPNSKYTKVKGYVFE